MDNSYMNQAERRANYQRAPAPSAVRVKRPILQPPWGYGIGRAVLTSPVTTSNCSRREIRERKRSVSSNGCCEAAACIHRCDDGQSNLVNSTSTRDEERVELGIAIQQKCSDSAAERSEPNEVNRISCTVAEPSTLHPINSPGVELDAVESAGCRAVISSSMETWTTYGTSPSSPRQQSTASSPHSGVTSETGKSTNAPLASPPAEKLRRMSPMSGTDDVLPCMTLSSPRQQSTASSPHSVVTSERGKSTNAPLASPPSEGSPVLRVSPRTDDVLPCMTPPSPRQQSIASSPHSVVTSETGKSTNAPFASPLSERLRRMSPKSVTDDVLLCMSPTVVQFANQNIDANGLIPSAFSFDVSTNQPTIQPEASETLSARTQEDGKSRSSWLGQLSPTTAKTGDVLLSVTATAAALANQNIDVTVAPASPSSVVDSSPKSATSNAMSKASERSTTMAQELKSQELNRVTSSAKDTAVTAVKTPVGINDDNSSTVRSPQMTPTEQSSLMVGLVNSPQTGWMIDCPILYQDEVQQSTSHKVVVIKAIVPRWSSCHKHAGQFAECPIDCSGVERQVDKMKSLVSVNTQTSDTLLPARRTASEQPPSPIASFKHVSPAVALEDKCLLMPSPKLSACSAKSKSPNIRLLVTESLENTSPKNTRFQFLARTQNNNPIPAEKYDLPLSPLYHSNMPTQSEESKELASIASMDCDSLMETLKLDLQLSSSSSDSDLVTNGHSANKCLNHYSSLSSEDEYVHPSSSSCPRFPPNSSAAAATVSSDTTDNYKTSDYVDEVAIHVKPSSSPRQKPAVSPHTPSSLQQRHVHTPNPDNRKNATDDASPRQSRPDCSSKNHANASLSPDSRSRPKESARMWRYPASNDDGLGSRPRCDFSCQDSHQPRRQSLPSQQQYASKSESLQSDRSKSTVHNGHEVTSTIPSRTGHTESSAVPRGQWINGTVGGPDTSTKQPLDKHLCVAHRRTNNVPSSTTCDVESATHDNCRNKRRATESKSPTQQRHRSATGSKRQQHDRSMKVTRHRETAQSSHSTGSMAGGPRTRPSAVAAPKRKRSSSATHDVPARDGGTRHAARCVSSERRATSSRQQYRSSSDNQRRRRVDNECQPASDAHRLAGRTTSSGRSCSREIQTSVRRSPDSGSRHRAGRPTSSSQPTPVTNSRQPRRHSEHKSPPASFADYPQPIIYCSPRSLKPFPAPISDRCPPSSFDSAAAGGVETSADGESFQRDDDYDQAGAGARRDHQSPPSNTSSPPCRLCRIARTNADELNHRRRGGAATVSGGRRNKLPTMPVVDGRGWCVEPEVSVRIAVPSVVERPAWKQY